MIRQNLVIPERFASRQAWFSLLVRRRGFRTLFFFDHTRSVPWERTCRCRMGAGVGILREDRRTRVPETGSCGNHKCCELSGRSRIHLENFRKGPRLRVEVSEVSFLGPTEALVTRCCFDDKEEAIQAEHWHRFRNGLA